VVGHDIGFVRCAAWVADYAQVIGRKWASSRRNRGRRLCVTGPGTTLRVRASLSQLAAAKLSPGIAVVGAYAYLVQVCAGFATRGGR
jgi:hypothetical protein